MALDPTNDPGNPFDALGPYELRNLVAHLDAAGSQDAVHRVLEMSTAAGRNAWYEAQMGLGDTAGYLADLERAWAIAEAASTPAAAREEPSDAIALHVRYALIASTLHTHAQSLPAALLAAALERRVWSGRRAMALVEQLRDPDARSDALAVVVPYLAEPLRGRALEELLSALRTAAERGALDASAFARLPADPGAALVDPLAVLARSVAPAEERAAALREVACRAPPPARPALLEEALAAARQIDDDGARVAALVPLVADLPEWLRAGARADLLDAAAATRAGRADALVTLAPFLAEAEMPRALKLARGLESGEDRVRAISALAPALSPPLLEEAAVAARKAKSKRERVALLAEIARHLPGPRASELRDEAVALARAMPVHRGRARALAAVGTRLPSDRRAEVLDEALGAVPPFDLETEEMLVPLAPFLSGDPLKRALALARREGVTPELLDAYLPVVPPRLKGGMVRSALAAARAVDWPPLRVEALAALLPHLSGATRERVAREALAQAVALEEGFHRSQGLAALAPHLEAPELEAALDATLAVADAGPRSLLLLELGPGLPEPLDPHLLEEALAEAAKRPNAVDRAPIVVRLAPRLPAPLRAEALRVVEPEEGRDDAGTDAARADVLEALAPYLGADEQAAALEAALSIGYLEARVRALAALAPRLTVEGLRIAFAAAAEIPPGAHADGKHGGVRHHGAEALAVLAGALPEPMGDPVLEEALAIARAVPWASGRAQTLGSIVPRLPGSMRPAAIADLLDALLEEDGLGQEDASALESVAPYLTPAAGPDALRAADGIREPIPRGRTLRALAAVLAPPLRERAVAGALAAAREVGEDALRVVELAGVAALATGSAREAVLAEALGVARTVDHWGMFGHRALDALLPWLAPEERDELLVGALRRIRELWEGRAKVERLRSIAPLLPAAVRADVLREVLVSSRNARDTASPEDAVPLDLSAAATLPRAPAHGLWTAVLREYSGDRRPVFVQHLRSLVPLVVLLGGEGAPAAARDAVDRVARWWP